MKQWEKANCKRFATISIHDSEDLVHPYEFKVTNYLVEDFKALQFPVFPLIEKPRLGNFFPTITTNTYVDEFAENHSVTMAGRHNSGAFVPSAGTGFSLRRDVIDQLGEAVLPENSLTEDYRLSLSLYEKGIQMHYVLEKVPRINHENRKIWEYIATRSLFPNTFKTAVKQKTRWILGITMQSFNLKELRNIQIPFIGKYSLYRDQKAKVGNLLSVLGYPILVYFVLSFFMPLNPIYPYQSLSWYLSLFVTVMMLERQLFRAYALWDVYGIRSAFFGTFFPPLLPFRLIWGNVINFTSTVKAYSQYYRKFVQKDGEESQIKKGIEEENIVQLNQMKSEVKQEEALQQAEIINLNPEDSEEKKFQWAKTDHVFLPKDILQRFHRKLGDVLLEQDCLTPDDLKSYLGKKDLKVPLGTFLMEQGVLEEKDLMETLSSIKHVPYLDHDSLGRYNFGLVRHYLSGEFLNALLVLPLLKTASGLVIAYSNSSPHNAQAIIKNHLDMDVHTVLTETNTVKKGLALLKESAEIQPSSPLEKMVLEGSVTYDQVVLIRNFSSKADVSETEIGVKMGLML